MREETQRRRLSFPAGGEDAARVDLGRKRLMFVLLDFLSADTRECCLCWRDQHGAQAHHRSSGAVVVCLRFVLVLRWFGPSSPLPNPYNSGFVRPLCVTHCDTTPPGCVVLLSLPVEVLLDAPTDEKRGLRRSLASFNGCVFFYPCDLQKILSNFEALLLLIPIIKRKIHLASSFLFNQ